MPIEISEGGVVISRADLATSHEEADNVIVQQVMSCAAENAESKIAIVADDTDAFVLLLHYHQMAHLKKIVLMESPIKGRTVEYRKTSPSDFGMPVTGRADSIRVGLNGIWLGKG